VLFADIRNSTGLIGGTDPEQAMQRMRPVLDAMKDAVHRYDGTVNKVQGDGVMALSERLALTKIMQSVDAYRRWQCRTPWPDSGIPI
jgi:class 3 adenylate cyclase